MPAPLSGDLRDRIVRAIAGGASARFDVRPSSAVKLMQRARATGSARPAKYGGHRRPVLEPYEAELWAMVEAAPRRHARRDQTALRRLGLRHKKIAEGGRAEPAPDLIRGPARRRAALARSWSGFQGCMDPERFVFLDKTGASSSGRRA